MILALILTLIFFIGSFSIQVTSSGYRTLEQSRSRDQLLELPYFFLYRALLRLPFREQELGALFFSVSAAKHILRLAFAVCATLFLWQFSWVWIFVGFVLLLLISLVVCDFLPRAWASHYPEVALQASAPFTSLFLLLCTPVTFLVFLVSSRRLRDSYLEVVQGPVGEVKEKIMEMISQAEVANTLDESEKRLLEGVAGFRDRIVREVMRPRVDIVALPITSTLREAATLIEEEGYSRIPVYREDIDHVIGILMYKDLLSVTLSNQDLDGAIEPLLSKPLFVPEMSRVTRLLQEFRQKQTHLAIVVDEYGGTEGIVTMEDCLEEIVGEISDETDEEEEQLFVAQKEGGWIVDARMTILDIEEEFGLKIPQDGDYDTVGGYAFHCAGEIPAPGLRIHQDDFDLEILEVTERTVEKVRIKPTA